jgi:hypothetical protein
MPKPKAPRAKAPHVVTQIVTKIHRMKQSLLDGTATVPDLLDELSATETLAYSLDGRRGALDPRLGGRVA